MGSLSKKRAGLYATACEKSPFRNKIDQWMNEGRSDAWISRQLGLLGDPISDVSVGKYRKYREQHLQEELANDPMYQAKVNMINENMVEEIGKIKEINVINHLADTIDHCAQLIEQSKEDDIRIKKVQDLRYVQMTMLETIKLYGDIVMQAQRFAKVEENPDLLKPAVTINVKEVLVDILGGMDDEQKFDIIDGVRERIGEYDRE